MPLLRFPFRDRPLRRGGGGRIQFVDAPGRGTGSGPNSGNPDRSRYLLIVLLSVGIGLGIAHNKWRSQRRADPVLSGVRVLTYPFQRSGAVAEASLFTSWKIIFRGRELEADNARLRAENDSLRTENESLRGKAAEADRLRSDLGLVHALKPPPLAAPLIALLPSPHFDSLIVARGKNDHIQLQSIARTPQGLIGQVIDVSPLTSEIMLLSDVNSQVGALVRRKGVSLGVVGIVQGEGRGRLLQIKDLKRDDPVQPGDEVVSSGYGGVFPPDIPIGTITEVKSDANALFLKSAIVKPAAGMPGDLREVFLLPYEPAK